jgi:endo-1,4-beta-xylanase
MKLNKNILMALSGALMISSCADNDPLSFTADKPAEMSQYEYLKSYDVLKNYVNRGENSHFVLGSAVNADEYNKKGVVYALTNTNFEDVVTGNAFKYASCVNAQGKMNFTTVKAFIDNATKAGLSVYGHTLAWHSQQNKQYLNSIIADRESSTGGAASYNYYIAYDCGAAPGANSWDKQATYALSAPLEHGAAYTLKAKIKADDAYAVGLWPIWNASPNKNQWGGSNDVQYLAEHTVSTEWQTYEWKFNASFTHDLLQFVFGKAAGKVCFDDLVLVKDGTEENLIANGDFAVKAVNGWGNNWQGPSYAAAEEATSKVPLTDQEKKDTLTWAMNNWVSSMMKACAGRVKAWDVVNEPISGIDKDGDGFFDLQSATRQTVDPKDAANSFYWQDYLGDVDYVRTVVAAARKYFVEYGGKAEDLKLFVNDYNLESFWDNNQKLVSLIDWIKKWEADGVTKIDGIGTQMHVSVNMNPEVQKAQEDAVVRMYELMAKTGKQVRISELDMGIIDADGKEVQTADATEEQLKAQAEYFNFIVRKYFEIVPEAQRYSICAWGQTDSPAGSGWRAGMPIGLWTENYTRKHAYAGFAEGLANKVFTRTDCKE